ncbi:hypothetical protein GCM10027162_76030 [Streptomyces incanus]
MPKKAVQDWEVLEQRLYAAGVEPAEVGASNSRSHLWVGREQRGRCGRPPRLHAMEHPDE